MYADKLPLVLSGHAQLAGPGCLCTKLLELGYTGGGGGGGGLHKGGRGAAAPLT